MQSKMPVLSPHRSGSSGSYRSMYGSSTLDRPFYGSAGTYTPRINSYSERYTSRSYTDADGRRIFSRTGSITEDGVTTRFREESREGSVRRDSRDSGISSLREPSLLDRREPSSSREGSSSRLSAINVVESVADIRNKYSPANYVPAIHRNRGESSNNISRSKTLNDIGLPPIEAKTSSSNSTSSAAKKKVTELNLNNTSCSAGVRVFTNNTNFETDNMYNQDDDNGNRPSVSEMRKKFDKSSKTGKASAPASSPAAVTRERRVMAPGKSKNSSKFNGEHRKTTSKKSNDVSNPSDNVPASDRKANKSNNDGAELRGGRLGAAERPAPSGGGGGGGAKCDGRLETVSSSSATAARSNHVNNFASYIPTKDFDKGDAVDNNGDMEHTGFSKSKKSLKDIASTSPSRLNHRAGQNSNSIGNSVINNGTGGSGANSQRNSSEREAVYGGRTRSDIIEEDRRYDRSSPGKQLGLNGLKNIGNTCFMNSVIQCLSNTKFLLEYLKKDLHVSDINTTVSSMKGALIKAFAQVIKELWSEDSTDRVVNTVSLKTQIQRFAPRFMGYSQQDAQEFLRYLLEGLHEDVNRVATKPSPIHTEIDESLSDSDKANESWQRYVRRENSKVVDIFVGQLKSTLRCTHCGHCSVTFDPFWDLSLPIPQKSGPVRLSQCLESFTREETLDGDEKPTCSKCKERRKCTKSLSIHKFPKILVIHLKRFSPTERFRGKLSVVVDFPLEGLDMSNYAAEAHSQCRYNLYAISNHSGTTYSGHYTAYCRHPYSQSWHEYNDSRVSTIMPRSIVSGEAYVLFYELDSKLSHL